MSEVSTLVDVATREVILDLAKFLSFGTYVEVGVYLGGNIIRVAKENLDDDQIKIYAVDNFRYENISSEGKQADGLSDDPESYLDIYHKNLADNGVENRIFTCIGDSINSAEKLFANCEVDILFLDGNHNWPYVKDELDAWMPRVKVGGVVIGHDYCGAEGIRKAADDRFGNSLFFVPDRSSYIACKGNIGVLFDRLVELKQQGKLVC